MKVRILPKTGYGLGPGILSISWEIFRLFDVKNLKMKISTTAKIPVEI